MEHDNIKKLLPMPKLNRQDLTISAQPVKRDLPKYLDVEVVRERLNTIPPGMARMLLTTLWMSGIRITEATNLRKQDIDFQNNVMRVRWLKSRKYKERNVPLQSKLRDLLYFFCGTMKAEERLFPITRQRGFQIAKKYMRISPHQLRHSFAVHFLRQGGNIVSLHRLLGHGKIQTTMEYLKIVPQDLREELESVDF